MTFIPAEEWQPEDGIQLDEVSFEAVQNQRSLAIQAGPGAGKTELLAQRAAFLLQTNSCAEPRKILAISFKRDAARNLRERVSERVGVDLSKRFDSFTFDAFAKSILDRFRESLPEWVQPRRDYEVGFPNWAVWRDFGDRPSLDAPFNHETFTVEQVKNNHAYLGHHPLPFTVQRPIPASSLAAMTMKWWDNALGADPQLLTFDMIKTLAHTIIHHNPQIKSALLRTYSHVFLDEFQDTNLAQYIFLKDIFEGTNTILTAVGDNKQLIMTFAGATSKRFNQFSDDFGAEKTALVSNFRSNSRIVDIVNSIAKNIEPEALTAVCSRHDAELPAITDGLVQFDNIEDQASGLAKFIRDQIQGSELTKKDFIILVRQKPDEHEECLQNAFAECGIALRNEARILGDSGIALQDIMSEPLAQLVILFIQVALGDRRNNAYIELIDLLTDTHASKNERASGQFTLENTLRDAAKDVRLFLETSPNKSLLGDAVDALINKLGRDRLSRLAREYRNVARFDVVKAGLCAFLDECSNDCDNWLEFVDNFLGINQVRLMTIHKSKGLEAHTIVFLSLQDDSFYYRANFDEEKLAFFVAVSRAKERVFFTKTRGSIARVAPLYKLLAGANVPELNSLT